MGVDSSNLIWVDLEMTGLDVATKAIIEVAVIVTDKNLQELGRWPQGGTGQAILQPVSVLDQADPWVRDNLRALLDRARSSPVDLTAAQEQALALVSQFCPGSGPVQERCPLAGNSIGQDRAFLRAYMPRLEKMTSYRNVDVSTIKELVKRWYSESMRFPKDEWFAKHFPGGKHSAMIDLQASIAELQHYRSLLFKTS